MFITAPVKIRALNLSFAKVGRSEIRLAKNRHLHIGPEKLRAARVSLGHVRAVQIRFRQVHFAKIGAAEIGFAQVGERKFRLREVRTFEIRALQVRVVQFCFLEIRAGKIGACKIGACARFIAADKSLVRFKYFGNSLCRYAECCSGISTTRSLCCIPLHRFCRSRLPDELKRLSHFTR